VADLADSRDRYEAARLGFRVAGERLDAAINAWDKYLPSDGEPIGYQEQPGYAAAHDEVQAALRAHTAAIRELAGATRLLPEG